MSAVLDRLMSREGRKWIYVVSLSVIGLLTGYSVIDGAEAGLWSTLVVAALGLAPATALTHLTPIEPKTELEPYYPVDPENA